MVIGRHHCPMVLSMVMVLSSARFMSRPMSFLSTLEPVGWKETWVSGSFLSPRVIPSVDSMAMVPIPHLLPGEELASGGIRSRRFFICVYDPSLGESSGSVMRPVADGTFYNRTHNLGGHFARASFGLLPY
ncbi:hypothetical protein STHE1630_00042 [Streptococcus thermophilus CNCM I-1630]|nr:hypothetical protein STHE1630_00042 [Streptococcus thermophilus CNCM I-1630]